MPFVLVAPIPALAQSQEAPDRDRSASWSADPADLNAQLFRPAIGAGHLLWVDGNGIGAQPLSSRVLMHYAKDPLVLRYDDGTTAPVVDNVLQTDVLLGWSAGPARLGVQLPFFVYQSGLAGSGPGFGDLGLDGRLVVVEPTHAPIGLGLGGRLFLPTSTVAAPLGADTPTAELTATLDAQPGRWVMSLNGGWLTTPTVGLGRDHVVGRAGLGYALKGDSGLTAETAWRVPLADRKTWGGAAAAGEWLIGGWSALVDGVDLRVAGGTGLGTGVGTPEMRLLAGVDWRPAPAPPDLDLDGLVGDADACPAEPEDVDGAADADGCPDLDDDGDGIADLLDGCRFDREDVDQLEDADGCPEPEVPVRLRVVNRAGDLVPLASAAVDGDVHEIGADVYLALVPGTYHLSATGDGYSEVSQDLVVDAAPVAVDLVLPPERIDLGRDPLPFGTNSATLLPAAKAALDGIARTLDEHPEIEVLRIEGHTDARGDAILNLRLSERRAAAVRAYLIEQGIDPERLVDQGYGESRPLDPAYTSEAYAKNRRVELVVDRWAD